MEILAANSARDPYAFGAMGAHSFTSKLLVEIRGHVLRGEKSIEVVDLMNRIQEQCRVGIPSHTVKVSLGAIVFTSVIM